jgi:Uma2 family endonuclease
MTVDEFLVWDGEPDRHYELIDGVPVLMPRTTATHQIVLGTLAGLLCQSTDAYPRYIARVHPGIVPTDWRDTYFETDAGVTSDPADQRFPYLQSPLVLFEIVSSATREHDRKTKLPSYRCGTNVHEIVLIDADDVCVEVHRREGSAWRLEVLTRHDATLTLRSVSLRATLAQIYAKTVLVG